MKKKHSAKSSQAAAAASPRDGILRQLAASQMQVAGSAGRLRIPIGYTATGDPIYEEIDGSQPTGDAARIWRPSGTP